MSKVYIVPVEPAGRNLASEFIFLRAGMSAAGNNGVSHRLWRRKLQQNLQFAQSLLARILLSILTSGGVAGVVAQKINSSGYISICFYFTPAG